MHKVDSRWMDFLSSAWSTGNTESIMRHGEGLRQRSATLTLRFRVKHPRSVQCGLAAPTPRPMMTTTTRATPCCSCSPTPLSRPLYLRTSLGWTSSWWPYPVVSLWEFSPLRNKTGLDLNPIFWLMILDATSGSEARPRLGLQATARVDVHLCRLPHVAFGSLEGSRQPERPWLTRSERRLYCAPERARRDRRASSRLTLSPFLTFFDLIRAIPCLSSLQSKKEPCA